MALFVTADEHYGHRNIIEFCKRPFAHTDEMEESMITNHNRKVGKGDITWHAGDMFWRTIKPLHAMSILRRLNGQHRFIWGNHDEVIEDSEMLQTAFAGEIRDIARIITPGLPKIVLCHYAMRVWRGSHQGAWHLYGHSHGELPGQGLSFDVGVDCNNYAPVSLEEIMVKMYQKHGDAAFVQMRKEKEECLKAAALIARNL